jgi:OOP family OmpA-OmpF porin
MASKWVQAFVLASSLVSATVALAADVKGSMDHPLLNRFPDSEIRNYMQKEYDATLLPKGKIDNRKEPGELLELEGKVTHISYRIPGERSALEVMRNYEKALKQGGFETLFSCSNKQPCGTAMMSFISLEGIVRPQSFGDATFGSNSERTLLAKRKDDAGDIHVFLHAVEDTANNRTYLYQQVVEGVPLELDQIQVLPADALQQSLNQQGYVAIPGIYFDTAKAVIKPESDAALIEIAKLLGNEAKLKVYVVGHTDNMGTLDSNVTLSQARAQAVVNALVASHRIDATRLAAKGVASLSPIASNAQEDGRARNRRVEIVVQ